MNFPKRLAIPASAFVAWELGVFAVAGQWFSGASYWLAAFMLTVLGLTVLTVYLTLMRFTMRQTITATAAGAAAEVPSSAPVTTAQVDAAPIQDLIQEADSRLRQSHAKITLSDLPLYLIAGPAGTGKTSTFLASGLSPELLAGQVSRESTVVPTAWCNLWYASGAIFAEAGGRFVTEDTGAWRELVKRLGKRTASLRGLIWCCDVTPFLGMPDPTRLDVLARKMQERLQAVAESLGSSFPVYVVFTKADQIPHFGDYFYRLTGDEDQQVLGCTLPSTNLPAAGDVYADAQTRRLLDPFGRLYASLAERRVPALARESDAERKPGVYEFPREIKRMRDAMIQFLVDGFRPNPLQPSPLLRGFYFCGTHEIPASATFEAEPATPVQRSGEATILFEGSPLSGGTAITTAPTATPLVTRWMFTTRLFHQVILADPLSQAAAAKNVHRETHQRFFYAAAAAACLTLFTGFTASWWNNSSLLRAIEAAVTRPIPRISPGSIASVADLQSLDQLRLHLTTLSNHQNHGAPISLRWGLYAGDAVHTRAREAYFAHFSQLFYTGTKNNLTARLLRADQPYSATYDTLKAYRMIASAHCAPDTSFLVPAFQQSWLAGHPTDPSREALATRQIRFYAAHLRHRNPYPATENQNVVDQARAYLAGFGGVDRLYRGILDEAARPPRKPARLADLAPNYQTVLASPGEVNTAFTREGGTQAEKAIREPSRHTLGEACVVGNSTAIAAGPEVVSQLTGRYQADYTAAWKEFLKQTAVQPFRNAGHAAKNLEILADHRSPLLAVFFLVSENTNTGATAKVFQPSREVSPAASRERLIEDPSRAYVNAIGDMQRAMSRLESDRPGNPDAALHDQARRAAENGLDAVRTIAQKFNINEAEGVDGEVKRLLESPFRHSLRLIITDPAKVGRDKAAGAARGFCSKLSAVQHKFPFNPQSDLDATAEEVAALFAPPSGALFTLQQQFAQSLTRQGKFWMARPDADPKPTPEFLAFLNRMSAISEALFADGQFGMRYGLRALAVPGVESVTLEIDGERLTGKPGAGLSKSFTWPASPASQQALVRVKAGASIPFASYDGLWAVFRLMSDADPRPAGSTIVELSKVRRSKGRPEAVLDANDKPIQVRLELTGLPNSAPIFDRGFFQGRCPVRTVE